MSRLVVFTNLTLDGVMQAPGRPDEDPRGNFERGGWAVPYAAMQSPAVGESIPNFGPLVLGRHTFEALYDFWSKQVDNPMTEMLNNMPKYVASKTLSDPLPWVNSILLEGDASEAVASLKAQQDDNLDLVVMGSGNLVHSLMKHELVDRYVLLIHPLVLGTGRRLFNDSSVPATLQHISTATTPSGVVIVTYDKQGD